jgi:hypothetical protein
MSYISRNTLLLLPMGLVLLWPYTAQMLDILPFDVLLSYMLYTKHVRTFPFPLLSLIIEFSMQPTMTIHVPYLGNLLYDMIPISLKFPEPRDSKKSSVE